MAAKFPILPVPTIADPCNESWEQMPGTARERHCGVCNQNVVNLAAMSSVEIDRLLAGPVPCLRIALYDDGTLVATEPRAAARLPRLVAGLVTAAMTFAGVAAQQPSQGATMGVPLPAPPQAQISGRLVDHAGHAIAGATVTLLQGGRPLAAVHDLKGSYVLSAPAGRYELRVESPLAEAKTISVELSTEHPVNLPVELVPRKATMGKVVVRRAVLRPPNR